MVQFVDVGVRERLHEQPKAETEKPSSVHPHSTVVNGRSVCVEKFPSQSKYADNRRNKNDPKEVHNRQTQDSIIEGVSKICQRPEGDQINAYTGLHPRHDPYPTCRAQNEFIRLSSAQQTTKV